MARRKLPYKEGDWFAVPLESETWALGLAARVSRGGGVLGYFFGPRRHELPMAADTDGLEAKKAVAVCKFGDLGLLYEEWPVVHRPDEWYRDAWPMPEFGRVDLVDPAIAYRTAYSEDRIEEFVTEARVSPEEARRLPDDCSYGYLALVEYLQQLLD